MGGASCLPWGPPAPDRTASAGSMGTLFCTWVLPWGQSILPPLVADRAKSVTIEPAEARVPDHSTPFGCGRGAKPRGRDKFIGGSISSCPFGCIRGFSSSLLDLLRLFSSVFICGSNSSSSFVFIRVDSWLYSPWLFGVGADRNVAPHCWTPHDGAAPNGRPRSPRMAKPK